MTDFTPSDLHDPEPPAPGARERALVAERAHSLSRRRRLLQGAGGLAVVAAVAVSVAALTAGGTSGAGGTNRVAAASAGRTTVSTQAAETTTAPATVATTVPAPTADTAPAAAEATPPVTAESVAPQAEVAPPAPVAPSTFTLSGSVSGVPAGSTATLTFTGPGGSFTVGADGGYSVSGLTAGDYSVVGQYTDTATGTATRAQRFGTVSVNADSSASFTFS